MKNEQLPTSLTAPVRDDDMYRLFRTMNGGELDPAQAAEAAATINQALNVYTGQQAVYLSEQDSTLARINHVPLELGGEGVKFVLGSEFAIYAEPTERFWPTPEGPIPIETPIAASSDLLQAA